MNTRRADLQAEQAGATTNAGLWLDKYIAGQKGENEQSDNAFKQNLVKEVCGIRMPDIYKSFFERWKDGLPKNRTALKRLKINGRMIVGLGAESVLEAGIALHRTYGVPFIAGNALKGLAAKYAHQKFESEEWRVGGKAHDFVFGSQSSAGYFTFYDALLIPNGLLPQGEQHSGDDFPLKMDVITVHHQDYYQGKTDANNNLFAPADWDSPVPVPFISATGSYLLAFSCPADADKKWLEVVGQILTNALREEGVGAKTSSGYGRASLDDKLPKTPREIALDLIEQERAGIESANQFIEKVESVTANDKESRKKAKEILKSKAGELFDSGWAAAQTRLGAQAVEKKVSELGLDISQSEWFPKIQKMAKEI